MSKPDKSSDAAVWLRQNGLRVTEARVAAVQVLDQATEPMTLAQIHARLSKTECDFATVFRFITALEEKGLVEKILWMDGSTRHEICKGTHAHHHHYLICRSCRKVEPIEGCVVEKFEESIARKKGYHALSHSLQLTGVCPNCQK